MFGAAAKFDQSLNRPISCHKYGLNVANELLHEGRGFAAICQLLMHHDLLDSGAHDELAPVKDPSRPSSATADLTSWCLFHLVLCLFVLLLLLLLQMPSREYDQQVVRVLPLLSRWRVRRDDFAFDTRSKNKKTKKRTFPEVCRTFLKVSHLQKQVAPTAKSLKKERERAIACTCCQTWSGFLTPRPSERETDRERERERERGREREREGDRERERERERQNSIIL